MSESELQLLRQLNETFNADGDWASFYAPDAELHMPPEWPEEKVYSGHDGLRKALTAWRGGFDEYHWREERLVDAGDHRIVGLYYHRGRDRQGGAWIDQAIGTVFTFGEDGKIVRLDGYFAWWQALEAAGVEE